MSNNTVIEIPGIIGVSAHKPVFLGFASAQTLYNLSFADILDENTGHGYQRRFNKQHSLDFRKYIQTNSSSTIPLTFNLRPNISDIWTIRKNDAHYSALIINKDRGKVFSQVDCQHRLGFLSDLNIELPFMSFIGLDEKEELEIFNIINSKSKGLSSSLLDFHDATLSSDLGNERPELFIALYLNNNQESPWYKQLDLGGVGTSGLMRRASLRTMQKAVKKFLLRTQILQTDSVQIAAKVIVDFWTSVKFLLQCEWDCPRKHLVTKGVGVYSLTAIAADIFLEKKTNIPNQQYFINKLSEFISEIDWTSEGDLKGFGGETGVKLAYDLLSKKRRRQSVGAYTNG